MSLVELLKTSGWLEEMPFVFRKANWIVVFDTGTWLEVGTDKNPRLFDVPVPKDDKAQWTLNLINHLCKTDDEIQKLKRN